MHFLEVKDPIKNQGIIVVLILTKDNLVKRKWKGCTRCCFVTSMGIYNICFRVPFGVEPLELDPSVIYGIRAPSCIDHTFGS